MSDCPGCDEWIATILASPAADRERCCPDCGAVVVLAVDERATLFARGDTPHPLPDSAHQDHDGTVSHRDQTETDSGQA